MLRTWVVRGGIALVALFLVIQLVPYGHARTNPPAVQEPSWDSAQTRELAVQSCYDCHSNQTTWPWYTNVAPISWLAQSDVDRGRARLNFSEWNRPYRAANEAGRQVQEGEMPPSIYLLAHPGARLSSVEQQALVQGLQATLGSRNASH